MGRPEPGRRRAAEPAAAPDRNHRGRRQELWQRRLALAADRHGRAGDPGSSADNGKSAAQHREHNRQQRQELEQLEFRWTLSMGRTAGFTLVELLVALFITAIMFTIGYRALNQAFSSRKEVDEQSARLIAVQQALRTIEQDFELLQPRPVRNLIGDGYLPAFMSSPNVASMLGSTSST